MILGNSEQRKKLKITAILTLCLGFHLYQLLCLCFYQFVDENHKLVTDLKNHAFSLYRSVAAHKKGQSQRIAPKHNLMGVKS